MKLLILLSLALAVIITITAGAIVLTEDSILTEDNGESDDVPTPVESPFGPVLICETSDGPIYALQSVNSNGDTVYRIISTVTVRVDIDAGF